MKMKFAHRLRRDPFRRILLIFADIVMLVCAGLGAFLLRFEGVVEGVFVQGALMLPLLNIAIMVPLLWWQRLYSINLSFVSIRDLNRLLAVLTGGTGLLLIIVFILRDFHVIESFPRSTILINYALTILFLGSLRILKRMARDFRSYHTGKKIIIIGAEQPAEQLARALLAMPSFHVVGFLDNNPGKRATTIHGVPVLGSIAQLPEFVRAFQVDEIILSEGASAGELIATAQANDIDLGRIKILPSVTDVMDGKVVLANLRDISIEDLLGRKSVEIDTRLMREFLQNKRVLVTGAAGSIGSQLIHAIGDFNPALLIAVDQNETGIFYLDRAVQKKNRSASYRSFVADVCDEQQMDTILQQTRPHIIFHAAAYKHVPIMEANPLEAIKNNVFGTFTVGTLAQKHSVEKVIFVSTDKAVRPVSVMGKTKHVGEKICVYFHQKNTTAFCAVRFGNVLDSQGNVIEVFKQQIQKGGPVEITHADMQRYFMMTAEACLLMMQAGALSANGEIFCLDMGKPVRILDLATEMIRLAGYQPYADIPIVFTHPRPGERLAEELLIAGEIPTQFEKIFIARLHGSEIDSSLKEKLQELHTALKAGQTEGALRLLNDLAPNTT